MPGELGAVVEGDTLAPLGREGGQDGSHCLGDGVSGLARGAPGDEQTGVAFVEGEDRLTVGRKEHQVGLPVAWTPAVGGVLGPLAQGPALGDEGGRAATPASPVAPFELGPWEVATPGVFLLTGQLGVDEAVAGLVGADLAAGHLLWGPGLSEAGQDLLAQGGIPFQTGTGPAAGPCLLLGIAGLVPLVREELRINSRATVDGARSRLAAIWRCECPAVRSRAISHRSSMVSC